MVTGIRLPSLSRFTISSANDTVFSFGGMDEDGQLSSDVNRYNRATKEWEPAGYMRSCRYSVIVSSFHKDDENVDTGIIVVGGVLGEIQQPKQHSSVALLKFVKLVLQFAKEYYYYSNN